jgi:6-pyruvoyltetrahydropterin/6-carboxytetrahydropterin synthase
MYKIKKAFKFAYSHILDLPYASPCTNLHGHNAKVIITIIATKLNNEGMIIDFSKLKPIVNSLLYQIDHSLVIARNNKIQITRPERTKVYYLPYKQSTAENFAKHIHDELIDKIKNHCTNIDSIEVKFYETDNNAAVYTENIEYTEPITAFAELKINQINDKKL